MESKNKHVRRSMERKQVVKHAVFSVDIIDSMIREEKDPRKLLKLRQLRKEAVKVWHP